MIEGYLHPAEMPEIFIDDDGIVNVLFGTILITVEHIIYCVDVQRKLKPDQKMPVMIVGEAALNVHGSLSKVGQLEWVADVTSALALVTQTKIARLLGNIFMSLQKNSFPTKLFKNEEDARAWLKKHH